MLRNSEEKKKYWRPYIVQLENQGVIFDLNNLLELHPRTLAGFTREEMIDEIVFSLKEAASEGYIEIINREKNSFTYTEKFQKEKRIKIIKQKFRHFQNESIWWIVLLGLIISVINFCLR